MHPILQKPLIQRPWQFLQRHIGKRGLVGLAVIAALYVVDLVLGDLVIGTVLPFVWDRWQALMDLPVRLFGILFFAFAGFLLILAFVDTSPTAAAVKAWLGRQRGEVQEQPPPTPLTREEQESVHRMRVMWKKQGAEAAEAMDSLYHGVLGDVVDRLYWAPWLRGFQSELAGIRNTMTQLFGGPSLCSLDEVIGRFNSFFRVYVQIAGALHHLDKSEMGGQLADGPHAPRYHRWKEANREFRQALANLHAWPEYETQLKVAVLNGGAYQFLDWVEF